MFCYGVTAYDDDRQELGLPLIELSSASWAANAIGPSLAKFPATAIGRRGTTLREAPKFTE